MDPDKIFAVFIVLLFVFSVIAYAVNFAFPSQNTLSTGSAYLEIYTCNQRRDIPQANGTLDGVYIRVGRSGKITFPPDQGTTLGEIFDLMNITFSETRLMGYENGNGCEDPLHNEVQVLVGGENERFRETALYRNYEIKNGDYIRVRYG